MDSYRFRQETHQNQQERGKGASPTKQLPKHHPAHRQQEATPNDSITKRGRSKSTARNHPPGSLDPHPQLWEPHSSWLPFFSLLLLNRVPVLQIPNLLEDALLQGLNGFLVVLPVLGDFPTEVGEALQGSLLETTKLGLSAFGSGVLGLQIRLRSCLQFLQLLLVVLRPCKQVGLFPTGVAIFHSPDQESLIAWVDQEAIVEKGIPVLLLDVRCGGGGNQALVTLVWGPEKRKRNERCENTEPNNLLLQPKHNNPQLTSSELQQS